MKIRTGFVSNSSSSSFIMCGYEIEKEDLIAIIKSQEFIDKFGDYYQSNLAVNSTNSDDEFECVVGFVEINTHCSVFERQGKVIVGEMADAQEGDQAELNLSGVKNLLKTDLGIEMLDDNKVCIIFDDEQNY